MELFGKCINTDRCALLLLTPKTNTNGQLKKVLMYIFTILSISIRLTDCEAVNIHVEKECQLTAGPSRRGTMQPLQAGRRPLPHDDDLRPQLQEEESHPQLQEEDLRPQPQEEEDLGPHEAEGKRPDRRRPFKRGRGHRG